MFDYYTSIILLCWLSLAILSILVWENGRIPKQNKYIFYISFLLIVLSSLAEWAGVKMNGNPNVPKGLFLAVKATDYILTPFTGFALVCQMRKNNLGIKILLGVLGFNILFQIISAFTGWMTIIDNNHLYSHGPLYPVYIVMYAAVILIVIIEFFIYGRSFKRQNKISLYLILLITIVGVGMQEILGNQFRTAYISLTFGVAMLFIHISEFSQIQSDEKIYEQKLLMTTDTLTGIKNRYAYTDALKTYETDVPGTFAVFLIDINGLKIANDFFGHEAGDELICGAVECINKVMNDTDMIFRIGGDEFVVFINLREDEIKQRVEAIKKEASLWHGEKVKNLSVSIGYALAKDFPNFSSEQLTKQADIAMYKDKSEYYQNSGLDRRKKQA